MNEENRKAEPNDSWTAEDEQWLLALQCAANPVDLPAEIHEHLVQEALAFAPTAEELVDSQAFRDELAAGTGEAAFLQEALRAALSATTEAPDPEIAQRVEAALAARPKGRVLSFRPRAFLSGAAVFVAMAAAALLYVRFGHRGLGADVATSMQASLVPARSTQELFDQPFEVSRGVDPTRSSNGVSRIDRIAAARNSDYRHNRFARWGVK